MVLTGRKTARGCLRASGQQCTCNACVASCWFLVPVQRRYIESLIEKEVSAGVPSERVVVAGFSQGGAVALLMLRSSLKLGGFVGAPHPARLSVCSRCC
jgi:alpha-beta hydrolase superfamily lysophospholipase